MNRTTGELRSFDDATGEFEVAAVTYNTVDTFGTRWLPGVFTESVRRSMPVAHFNHNDDPARRIADFHDYREEPGQFVLVGQMRPREKSTWIRRAWEGLRSQILTDFSVVFSRKDWRTAKDGVVEFVTADLHRVDLVLDGSVPGARLLSFRTAQGLGPVAARIAAAERLASNGLHLPASSTVAMREAQEALAEIDGL